MDDHIEGLYRLRQDIESISAEHQQRLLLYLTLRKLKFTENANGIFFNLSTLTEEELNDLRTYIESIKEIPAMIVEAPVQRAKLRMPGVNPYDWTKVEDEPEEEEIQEVPKKRRRPKAAKPTKQQQRILKRMREFCKKTSGPIRQRRQQQQHETEDFGVGAGGGDDDDFDLDMDYDLDDIPDEMEEDFDDEPEDMDYGEEDRGGGDFDERIIDDIVSESESEDDFISTLEVKQDDSILQAAFAKIPDTLPLSIQWTKFVSLFPKLQVLPPVWM